MDKATILAVIAELSDSDSSDSSDAESDWEDSRMLMYVNGVLRANPCSSDEVSDVISWGLRNDMRLSCVSSCGALHVRVLDIAFDASKVRIRGVMTPLIRNFRMQGRTCLSEARTFLVGTEVSWEGLRDGNLCVLRRGALSSICDVPRGHVRAGQVLEGHAESVLNSLYSDVYENGVRKYAVSGDTVEQQCPCGKLECDVHVFPSTLRVTASFPLRLRSGKRVGENLESLFEASDCMTRASALAWWSSRLKVRGEFRGSSLHLLLRCGCGGYHDVVPCAKRVAQGMRACVKCAVRYPRRSLRDGLCQQCYVEELIDCQHCKKRVPRRHTCVRLMNEYVGKGGSNVYPPCRRSLGSSKVLCPDCQESMDYNVYHRHQYRRHCYLRGRAHKFHKCDYCNFRTADRSVLNTHMLTHMVKKQYLCKFGCGKKFSSPEAEMTHRQRLHHTKAAPKRFVMLKRRRIVDYESEDEMVHV